MKKPMIKVQHSIAPVSSNNSMRKFLKMGSLAVVGTGFLLSCSNDDDIMNPVDPDVFDLEAGFGNIKLRLCLRAT